MSSIVHFDLPADDLARAEAFYSELFGWKFTKYPGPMEYYLIETRTLGDEEGVRGGMGKRGAPDQQIMPYFGVESVDTCLSEVTRLGGNVLLPKTAVPGFGYLAVCTDTEKNRFGVFEEDPGAR